MNYVSVSLLSIFLIFFEISFLPYFKVFGATPYVFLAFIILLSIRVRWFFTYWIAFLGGLIFDYSTGSNLGLFVATFVFISMISRALFFRKTNYLSIASYTWLIVFGTVLTFIFQIYMLQRDGFSEWSGFFLSLASKTLFTLLIGFILFKILDRYMDWLNKSIEERYR